MSDIPKRAPIAERLKNGIAEGIEYARNERDLARKHLSELKEPVAESLAETDNALEIICKNEEVS